MVNGYNGFDERNDDHLYLKIFRVTNDEHPSEFIPSRYWKK